MIGTCDQSDEFLLVQMSAIMFKLYVLEVKRIRLEHVSYFRNFKWLFQIKCVTNTSVASSQGNVVSLDFFHDIDSDIDILRRRVLRAIKKRRTDIW